MTARPWMPFYFSDYLADTAHLSTAEHGAYFLLIAHYWSHGRLPNDDTIIRRITRMTPRQWAKSGNIIRSFFGDHWCHKRIDKELSQAIEKSRINSANAKRRHSGRSAAAVRMDTQPEPQSEAHKEDKKEKTGKILLPDTWVPSESHYDLARKKGLSREEVEEASSEMRSWSLGNGEKRRNWDWVFNNWLRRNAKRTNGNGSRGSRTLQDDSKSVSRAAGRLAEAATRGEFTFGPRPSLLPGTDEAPIRLLPKG